MDVFEQSSSTAFEQYGLAIAVDGADRVFAAGVSRTNYPGDAVVRRSVDHGATWQTVDASSGWDYVRGMAVSPSGVVVVVGSAVGNASSPLPYYWRVRLSSDGGTTWSTVDELPQYWSATAAAFGADGSLYVGGYDDVHWLVRRSGDFGVTWSDVTNVPQSERLYAMTLTSTGMVLAGGRNAGLWTVIQSTNQLADWSLLDSWRQEATGNYAARGIAQDISGNLVIVGGESGGDTEALNWAIRRSTNGGADWAITDQLQFPLVNGHSSIGRGATAVVTDIAGRMWATGSDGSGILTRVSRDGGATWTDSEAFHYADKANGSAFAEAIASDSLGNIFVVGWVNPNLPERPRWIVRRLEAGLPFPPLSFSTSLSGNALSLTWPASATSFVLQSAPTLAYGGDWQDATNAPTEINGQKVVTITPTGPRGFFRLRGP